ncbi:hypothetical protein ADUPG1_012626 [Aduncisulcus paluster]|uniref:Uncharacterized protein n=1 Tax=Aduncisulcus paluster TaxID=2918883 RepID=A0ABQ5K046_9EUKA|nr:hypothetical protein ADUPG1_012626 [Aduncisulcus paluster]
MVFIFVFAFTFPFKKHFRSCRTMLRQSIYNGGIYSFFPQFISHLPTLFPLGLEMTFQDTFVEDILEICLQTTKLDYSSTKDFLIGPITDHIVAWMEKYPDIHFMSLWASILGNLTQERSIPNLDRSSKLCKTEHEESKKLICSEAFSLFHPVLASILEKEKQDSAFDIDYGKLFEFFTNLCVTPSLTTRIYDNIRVYLHEWYLRIRDNYRGEYWYIMVTKFSSVQTLIPQLSPEIYGYMRNCYILQVLLEFLYNIISHVAKSYISKHLHDIPMISVIPSMKTSPSLEFNGLNYATRFYTDMRFLVDLPFSDLGKRRNFTSLRGKELKPDCLAETNYFDIMSGTLIDFKCLDDKDEANSHIYMPEYSFIKYSLPSKKILATIPIEKERELKQSMYDLIESTSAGVEIFFQD